MTAAPGLAFDVSRRFVTVTNERASGLVEFDFAVGEPGVFVEMILPRQEFAAFCKAQAVTVLTPVDGPAPDGPAEWRLRDATKRHVSA